MALTNGNGKKGGGKTSGDATPREEVNPVSQGHEKPSAPFKVGLSQIEKEFSAVNQTQAAPTVSGAGFSGLKAQAQSQPSGGSFPMIKGLVNSLNDNAGGCLNGGCFPPKSEPEQSAIDDILKIARDRQIYKNMQPEKPTYGPAGPSGVLPHQAYYPNANDNIVKGYVQGSRIGSNPIFAAGGGLMPVGIWDAHKKVAQKTAARQAAKAKQSAMEFDDIEADKKYEETLNQYWWKHEEKIMNDAFREYGASAEDMINNPNTTYGRRRAKLHQQLSTLGGLTQELNTTFKDKLTAMKDDETATALDIAVMEEYMNGMAEELGRLSPDMTDKEVDDVTKLLNGRSVAANQHMNMIKVYNEYASKLKADISESVPQILPLFSDTDEDGNPWTEQAKTEAMITYTTSEVASEKIDQMQQEIWDNQQLRHSIELSYPTLDDDTRKTGIRAALEARLPTKNTNSASKVSGGSSTSGWLGSKAYDMDPITMADVPANIYTGDVKAAYAPRRLKGSSKITWTITPDDQVYFPQQQKGPKWYGKPGVAIDLKNPQLVHSSVMVGGKEIEGWFVNGTTDQSPSSNSRNNKAGVYDKDKEVMVSIPIHVGPEGKEAFNFRGGTMGIQTLSNSLGVKPQALTFFFEHNGNYPETVIQGNKKFAVKKGTGGSKPGEIPEYVEVGDADGTESVSKTVNPEPIVEVPEATSPLDSAAAMEANIARLDSAITDWTSPLPVDENGMVSPYRKFKSPEGHSDVPSKIKEDKGYKKAWYADSERLSLPKDLKIDAFVDQMLQFEHDYGTAVGGKATGLEGYQSRAGHWNKEITTKYWGDKTFTDQSGNTKRGLKMDFPNLDEMPKEISEPLKMYHFNTGWDPRVLMLMTTDEKLTIKNDDGKEVKVDGKSIRGKMHQNKRFAAAVWEANKDKVNYTKSKKNRLLDEMEDIYNNTWSSGEDRSKPSASLPSYQKRMEFLRNR